jgi:hypothetical protein
MQMIYPVLTDADIRRAQEKMQAYLKADTQERTIIPRIGYWWSACCELDLYEIENEEDLEEVRDFLSGELGASIQVFTTREAGLSYYREDQG